MIDGENSFHQRVNSDLRTYVNFRKDATVQGDDYTASCLLHHLYFKEYYKLIAIDLNKQQALDADPIAIQQINFTRNLIRDRNIIMFFIIGEAKEIILDFSQKTVRIL